MATNLILRLSLSPTQSRLINHTRNPILWRNAQISSTRRRDFFPIRSKAVEIGSSTSDSNLLKYPHGEEEARGGGGGGGATVLLDVSGMMCGGCVSRVKSILSADKRVESAAENILTETAAVKLVGDGDGGLSVGEELGRRLTECGFPSETRSSGRGIDENLKKWKGMNEKKEMMLKKSQSRVLIAWGLVALCCLGRPPTRRAERVEAENMFSSKEAEEEAKKESAQTFVPGEVPDATETSKNEKVPKVVAPTPEQIIAIKAAIVNSQTLEEVARLEQALKSGQLPAGFNIPDDNNDNKMDLDPQKEAITESDNTNDKQLDNDIQPIEED